MSPVTAATVVIVLLTAVSIVGLTLQRRKGRVHEIDENGILGVHPHTIGVSKFGAAATIVQFSTKYCARCPAVRNAITRLVKDREGVEFAHVDLTNNPELARRFNVVQTPTILLFDGKGVAKSRLSGPLSLTTITAALNGLREGI